MISASSLGLPKNMRKAAQTAALGKPFLVDVGVFGKPVFRLCGGVRSIYGGILFDPQETKIFGASGYICWKPSNA
ncbi:MAG: hypothetical protein ACLT76_18675 [Clostridium fessum]